MQVLVFKIGDDSYGLYTRHVQRVLPLMALKDIPLTPAYVAGLMNFHGTSVPVIDLNLLAGDTPCAGRFDTRIILVDYFPVPGSAALLGLIAEHVKGVERLDADRLHRSGVVNDGAPFLGQVLAHNNVILQLVDVEHLLPEKVRNILFPSEEQAVPT